MNTIQQADIELVKTWRKSPLAFVRSVWGLEPEFNREKFVKGKHITQHQYEILTAIEKALRGEASRKISIRAGHGIGKSGTVAWLILWFLFCWIDAQVSATAPTSQQMFDVLWKEVKKWIDKMPKPIAQLYEWTSSYVRMKEKPETWFARAATARKEAPEAFAGIHGEHVLLIGEEASGIPEEIFDTGRGALTNANALVVLIGNPTRSIGYFYDTHHGLKSGWQTLHFSSLESPLVDLKSEMIQEIVQKYGEDSDEYRIRVLGMFPKEDAIDDKGYVPLFIRERTTFVPEYSFRNTWSADKYMGIDPSGEGRDRTAWVIRDSFGIQISGDEQTSTPKSIAEKTITLMDYHGIREENVFIDGFGVGAEVAREIFVAGRKINVVLTSNKPNEERFLNVRAEIAFRFSEWTTTGGRLVRDQRWEELFMIKFKRNLQGKLQIMDKVMMRKTYGKSPDYFDAACLTFMNYTFLGGETNSEAQSFIPKHSYWK